MGIIDDLQLGLKNGVVGTHVRKVKRQTQKVKATVQNAKVRGPQIGHGAIPYGIGVEPLQLVYAFVYGPLVVGAALFWASRSIDRFVVRGEFTS